MGDSGGLTQSNILQSPAEHIIRCSGHDKLIITRSRTADGYYRPVHLTITILNH